MRGDAQDGNPISQSGNESDVRTALASVTGQYDGQSPDGEKVLDLGPCDYEILFRAQERLSEYQSLWGYTSSLIKLRLEEVQDHVLHARLKAARQVLSEIQEELQELRWHAEEI